MTGKTLIDCHVHLAALSDGDNGCYISSNMLKSPLFRFLLWKHQLSPSNPREANRKYLDDLLSELRASRHVQKAVILGMDGVYDQNGRLNREQTDFLISNDYVLKTAQAHPEELLAGVSINPQRRDAIDEVHRCADAGAALVKVLPNAQQFNPADMRYKAFYRTLAERKLPFLSHVGYEFSLIGKDQSVGDPDRLRLALDEGATGREGSEEFTLGAMKQAWRSGAWRRETVWRRRFITATGAALLAIGLFGIAFTLGPPPIKAIVSVAMLYACAMLARGLWRT